MTAQSNASTRENKSVRSDLWLVNCDCSRIFSNQFPLDIFQVWINSYSFEPNPDCNYCVLVQEKQRPTEIGMAGESNLPLSVWIVIHSATDSAITCVYGGTGVIVVTGLWIFCIYKAFDTKFYDRCYDNPNYSKLMKLLLLNGITFSGQSWLVTWKSRTVFKDIHEVLVSGVVWLWVIVLNVHYQPPFVSIFTVTALFPWLIQRSVDQPIVIILKLQGILISSSPLYQAK